MILDAYCTRLTLSIRIIQLDLNQRNVKHCYNIESMVGKKRIMAELTPLARRAVWRRPVARKAGDLEAMVQIHLWWRASQRVEREDY